MYPSPGHRHESQPHCHGSTNRHPGAIACSLIAGSGPAKSWHDPAGRHRVGCLDASRSRRGLPAGRRIASDPRRARPPVQSGRLRASGNRGLSRLVPALGSGSPTRVLDHDASLYVWLGADQNDGFQPLADFIIMMRGEPFQSRSLITMRNQRGYGTAEEPGWPSGGSCCSTARARRRFTSRRNTLPENFRILRGYYKEIDGSRTDNLDEAVPRRFAQGTSGSISSRSFIGWTRTSPAVMRRSP